MPASLIDDATQWLRQQGAPLTTRNLNSVQAYLAENPDQRPSYADTTDMPEGVSRIPEGVMRAFSDGEPMQLDTGMPPEARMPGRKPGNMQPRIPQRKPAPPVDEESGETAPDAETGPGEAQDLEGMRGNAMQRMYGDAEGTPNPLRNADEQPTAAAETIQYLKSGLSDILGLTPKDEGSTQSTQEPASKEQSSATDALTTAGAAVGTAASLAAELKKAYDAYGNDQEIRDRFAKNIGSRVANATRGTSESGALPKNVRPTLQPYQETAINEALRSIKDGDMGAAEKWLTFLPLEDQKALRSSLAQTPAAARVPPTPVQRGMATGEQLIRSLGNAMTRGRVKP